MKLFQLREREIFETLMKIRRLDFVLIGGYAVNTYALPRFSADCDIVVRDSREMRKVESLLLKEGYRKLRSRTGNLPYGGKFFRFEKTLEKGFRVSVDVLVSAVMDRQTGAVFGADWIFGNSRKRVLRGKTIGERLKLRIVNPGALVIMKLVSCRGTDIRDVFMMLPKVKDLSSVRAGVDERTDFLERYSKLKGVVTSREFKSNLGGVFGYVDEKVFNKHKGLVLKLGKA